MFGYVRAYEDELKVRNLRLYKSAYCGLCKVAGKRFGWFSKLFLSYDYTFFAVVRMIFTSSPIRLGKKRCGFRLFGKKDVILENDELRLSASIFSILTYYKLLDNIRDEGFPKSLGARLLLPIASGMRRKAVRGGYSEVDFIVSDCIERLSLLEKRKDASLSEASNIFGDMMGSLLSMGLSEAKRRDAYSVGFEVGSFIYRADALDDLESDEKSGGFNPLLIEYGSSDMARTNIAKARGVFLGGTDRAADILSELKSSLCEDGKRLCEVAQNILYLGCPSVVDGILCKDTKGKEFNIGADSP